MRAKYMTWLDWKSMPSLALSFHDWPSWCVYALLASTQSELRVHRCFVICLWLTGLGVPTWWSLARQGGVGGGPCPIEGLAVGGGGHGAGRRRPPGLGPRQRAAQGPANPCRREHRGSTNLRTKEPSIEVLRIIRTNNLNVSAHYSSTHYLLPRWTCSFPCVSVCLSVCPPVPSSLSEYVCWSFSQSVCGASGGPSLEAISPFSVGGNYPKRFFYLARF